MRLNDRRWSWYTIHNEDGTKISTRLVRGTSDRQALGNFYRGEDWPKGVYARRVRSMGVQEKNQQHLSWYSIHNQDGTKVSTEQLVFASSLKRAVEIFFQGRKCPNGVYARRVKIKRSFIEKGDPQREGVYTIISRKVSESPQASLSQAEQLSFNLKT